MQDIFEKIREMPEVELPDGFHDRIMDHVVSFRFKKTFHVILALLLLNFGVAASFLFIRLLDNKAFLFINFMLKEFEVSGGYLNQLISVVYHNVPLGLLITVFLNIILVSYVVKIYFSFKNAGRAFLKLNQL